MSAKVRDVRARAWASLPDRDTLTLVEAAARLDCSPMALRKSIQRARRDGLELPRRKRWPHLTPAERDAILEDWEFLRDSDGTHWTAAADRLDVSRDWFWRLLKQLRHDGDDRGCLTFEAAVTHRRNP